MRITPPTEIYPLKKEKRWLMVFSFAVTEEEIHQQNSTPLF